MSTSPGGEIVRQAAQDASYEHLLRQLQGTLTSIAASQGTLDVTDTLRLVRRELLHRLNRQQVSFEELVEVKARRRPKRASASASLA